MGNFKSFDLQSFDHQSLALSSLKRSMFKLRYWPVLTLMCLLGALAAAPTQADDVQMQPLEHLRFCVTCHGVDGSGNEAIRAPRLAGQPRWYLRRQLLGFQAGFRGFHSDDLDGKEMRPMAEALSATDIEGVLDWIESWPILPVAPLPPGDGDSLQGKLLYQGCSACHGQQGQGDEAFGGPALAGLSRWYLTAQLQKFKTGLRGTQPEDHLGQQMRAMTGLLADDQAVKDVVSYIETLSSPPGPLSVLK